MYKSQQENALTVRHYCVQTRSLHSVVLLGEMGSNTHAAIEDGQRKQNKMFLASLRCVEMDLFYKPIG